MNGARYASRIEYIPAKGTTHAEKVTHDPETGTSFISPELGASEGT